MLALCTACGENTNSNSVIGSSSDFNSSKSTASVSDPIVGIWEFEGLSDHGGAASTEELEYYGIDITLKLEVKENSNVLITGKDDVEIKGKWKTKGDNYSMTLWGEEVDVKLIEDDELFMISDGQQLVFQKVSQ